ncbi:uncharacterized protein LOC125302822 [Alosa alosa]|uniref:uncharacterized protein LOC125302822 n=1 Tax=Alosa alosa TaxID=278164 RepID=UPI0020150669|nr:uncharacterized protein LOC125302822 [Alosa alosa]
MDASTAELSHTRAEVTSPLFGAFGSSGGGSWSLPRSDSWNYLPLEGDPWSYSASDPEFSNVSSPETISPSSVMDFFSPPGSATAAHSAQSPSPSPVTTSSSSCEESGCSGNGAGQRSKRKLRSRNPSRQRQSASEKEKLRMRDLTKALHHLRTYLPPSVAPAGQTLTKIQTLRLAIRYIAHLSAQLGTREELRSQSTGERDSLFAPQTCFPEQEGRMFTGQCWGPLTQSSGGTETKQGLWQRSLELSACHEPHSSPYGSAYEDLFNSSIDSLLQSPVYTTETRQSYQEYGKDMTFHSVAPECWI